MPVSHSTYVFRTFHLLLTLHLPITNEPQAYNSIFNTDSSEPTTALIGNFPLLPLRTRVRGPAYTLPLDASLPQHLSPEPDSESYDALDEVLSLFRANTFFRNFEIQGPADRLLIYGILWVSECLGKIRPNMSARYVGSTTGGGLGCAPMMGECLASVSWHDLCLVPEVSALTNPCDERVFFLPTYNSPIFNIPYH